MIRFADDKYSRLAAADDGLVDVFDYRFQFVGHRVLIDMTEDVADDGFHNGMGSEKKISCLNGQ